MVGTVYCYDIISLLCLSDRVKIIKCTQLIINVLVFFLGGGGGGMVSGLGLHSALG